MSPKGADSVLPELALALNHNIAAAIRATTNRQALKGVRLDMAASLPFGTAPVYTQYTFRAPPILLNNRPAIEIAGYANEVRLCGLFPLNIVRKEPQVVGEAVREGGLRLRSPTIYCP